MRSRLENVSIVGLAAGVPITSHELAGSEYGTPERRAKFIKSTGIQRIRLANSAQCTSDFAEAAANRLIDELGWERDSVDLLVFVSQSPDYRFPATACTLQDRMGLSTKCAAFDVSMGCSGYAYGLRITGSMLSAENRRALLLVGDVSDAISLLPSRRSDFKPMFGDAATATALEWSPGAADMFFDLRTDGSGFDAIIQPDLRGRRVLTEDNFHYEKDEAGNITIDSLYQMKGEDVFNFAVRQAPAAIEEVLDWVGRDREAIDYYLLHQANKLINETIRKRLKLPPEALPESLSDFGNTSSASIPLTMVHRLREQLTNRALSHVLCGFGVGLSWGTVYCETDRIVCPELVEI